MILSALCPLLCNSTRPQHTLQMFANHCGPRQTIPWETINQGLLQPQGELYPIHTIFNHRSQDQLFEFRTSFYETISNFFLSILHCQHFLWFRSNLMITVVMWQGIRNMYMFVALYSQGHYVLYSSFAGFLWGVANFRIFIKVKVYIKWKLMFPNFLKPLWRPFWNFKMAAIFTTNVQYFDFVTTFIPI